VVHFEIGRRDREQTADCYAELFGWESTEAGPASMIDTQAGSVGIQGPISSSCHEPR
jgi:predicted enzyme related to lactoylglutathione lyase